MGTSGVRTITKTAGELIRRSFMTINQHEPTASFPPDMSEDALEDLNAILAMWQAEGIGIWNQKFMTLYLQKGKGSYLIGPSGDNATYTSVETTIAVAAVLGATTITLTTNSGMTDADYIGVQLDDGTMQWTTITTVLPANQVLLADALTDSAAASKVVYSYTTKADRPVELAKMVRRSSDGTDQDLWEISRVDYLNTPQKTNAGPVIQWYYDQQMTNGVLYVWETPDDVAERLVASVRQPFEFTTDLVNDIEMPFEWYRVLKWELAAEIATEYGVSLQTIAYMEGKAERLKNLMSAYDMDKGSFYFQPDLSR